MAWSHFCCRKLGENYQISSNTVLLIFYGIKVPWFGTLLFKWWLTWNLFKLEFRTKRIEYLLEWNLVEKRCKTAILLYCFHTAGVLHIFFLYNLLGPWTSFYRKSKINIKRKSSYEIGWFHNLPMIISLRRYAFHFTNDDFPL